MRNIGISLFSMINPWLTSITDPAWRQFRFTIGAPDAEAKFKVAIKQAQQEDKNAVQYPSIYVGIFVEMLVYLFDPVFFRPSMGPP